MTANTIIVSSLLVRRSEILATHLFDYLFIVCDHNDGLMYGLMCIVNNQKFAQCSFHSTIYALLPYLVYPLLQTCPYFSAIAFVILHALRLGANTCLLLLCAAVYYVSSFVQAILHFSACLNQRHKRLYT